MTRGAAPWLAVWRGPCTRAHLAALCCALTLLGACANNVGGGAPKTSSDGGASAGDTPVTRQPSATTTPGQSPERSPQPAGPAPSAGTSAGAVKIGSGKSVTLASFEGDITCTRLVAPFDLSDNLSVLTDLATTGGVSVFSSWLDSVTGSKSARDAANAAMLKARHHIALEARTTALRMNWLPMSAEMRYGRMVLDKMKDDLLERDSTQGKRLYVVADALLNEILSAISEPHAYKFEVFIRTSSGENAMALPGGYLILDAALVKNDKLRSKAKFAVTHEISHVLQRHETRGLQARIIDTVSLGGTMQDLIKAIRSMRSDPTPIFRLLLAGKLQFEQHYSSQELHADGCGVRLLDQVLHDNLKLAGVLRSFVGELVAAYPVASRQETAPDRRDVPVSLQPISSKVDKTAEDVKGLVNMVTRPIDRHPAPKERIDNLNHTLAEVTKRPKAATVAPLGTPAAGGKPAPTPSEKSLTMKAPPAKGN